MRNAAVLIMLLLSALSASADHAPEWLMSKATPETTLAGLVAGKTTIAEVERRFGKAVAQSVAEHGLETEYSWHLALSDLTVTTIHARGEKRATQIVHSITVRQREGKQSQARTGAGVQFGDTLDALLRAYGTRYLTSWRRLSPESATVTFVFENETELSAGFSDEGRIIVLFLLESPE